MNNRYSCGNRAIQRSLLLASDANRVFELLSSGRGMEQWFCSRVREEPHRDLEGRRVLHLEFDLKGGVERIDAAVVEEMEPPRRVSAPPGGSPGPAAARFGLRWQAAWPSDSELPARDTIASFVLYPEGSGTRLVFCETGFDDGREWDHALDEQSRGWDECFGRLMRVADTQSTRVIETSAQYACSTAALWDILTQPASVAQWLEEPEFWDARQGGCWKIRSPRHGTGQGRFMYCDKPRLLSLSWDWYSAGRVLVPTWVEFSLSARGEGGCQLGLRHGGFGQGPEWDAEYEDHLKGWQDCLAAIGRLAGAAPLAAAGGAS
ncbi:SRPBCC domain-containing protein [bacterium]|nr:SRPBCC domain-containing protein [bacterium]